MNKNKWEEYGKWRHGELRNKYNNMNILDDNYKQLLLDILKNGVEKKDRTGTGTLSVFGRQIRHKMSEGFPLLTTKKMHWNSIVTELLWFLRGSTNIKFLLDYDCHIWDGDVYKNYAAKTSMDVGGQLTKEEFIKKIKTDLAFALEWGDLGRIYGKQWRSWKGDTWIEGNTDGTEGFYLQTGEVDQIANLINELKTNPDSRRLMVSAWNPGELDQMVLPPCHYGFQVYTRELDETERVVLMDKKLGVTENFPPYYTEDEMVKHNIPKRAISLMWNQRSVDTFLGLPFNIASYGLLLEIIAREVGMLPDEIIGNLGDVHLYKNHIEQAEEQISRTPYGLPSVQITERNWYLHHKVKEYWGEKTFSEKILSYRPDCFELIDYQSHPKIKAPLSN
jgi:thymidylate synthase